MTGEDSSRHTVRRRLEDVEYWRKRSGWFDDDRAMKDYNDGIYDTYYQADDNVRRGGMLRRGSHSAMIQNVIKVLSILIALALCVLMFRAIMRRLGSDKKEKKSSRSESKSRSGSNKRSGRSRSRSRSRKDYDLMEDSPANGDDDGKSRRSRSSKSRRSRSRSKSKSRSTRSRSRARKTDEKEAVMV